MIDVARLSSDSELRDTKEKQYIRQAPSGRSELSIQKR